MSGLLLAARLVEKGPADERCQLERVSLRWLCPDFPDRLVTVDPNAEPTNSDEAVAEFLVSFYRSTLDASRGGRSQFSRGTRKVGHMSLQFQIEQGGSTVPAGAFRARFTEVGDTEHEEYGAGLRFVWKVVGGDHDGEETSRITGIKPTPKNALGKILAGLTGGGIEVGQTVDIESCIGREYLINVGETKGGGTRVESVIRADV